MGWRGAAILLLLAGTPAAAQIRPEPAQLRLRDGRDYRHKPTRITLPPTIDGLVRGTGTELIPDEQDVFVQYRSADGADFATLYLYRPATGSMPLWFAEAVRALSMGVSVGAVTEAAAPAAFALAGRTVPTALSGGFRLDGRRGARSSALAMTTHDGWLVKLRYSSGSPDVAATVARAQRILAAVGWPEKTDDPHPAAPIAACTRPLAIDPAGIPVIETAEARMQRALIGGVLMVGDAGTGEDQEPASPPVWCRHPAADNGMPIYGIEGQVDGYLIPLSDTGIALRVDPSIATTELLTAAGDAEPAKRWGVTLWTPVERMQFGTFTGLPPFQAAIDNLRTRPISAVGRDGTLRINGDGPGID